MESHTSIKTPAARAPAWIERLLAHGGYPLLFVCAGLMDLRRVLAVAVARSHDDGVLRIFDEVNFLVFAQWFCLIEIARRIDWSGVRASRLETLAGLTFTFCAGFLVTPQSHIFTAILGFWIAIKLARVSRQTWVLAIPLALVSIQDVPSKEYWGYSLSALMVPFDVFGAHSLLRLAGYAVKPIDGTTVRLVDALHGIKVIPHLFDRRTGVRVRGGLCRVRRVAARSHGQTAGALRPAVARRRDADQLGAARFDGAVS